MEHTTKCVYDESHYSFEGHRRRLKEKFVRTGFEGFNDQQIIELILFYCYNRIDTSEMSKRLVNHFGNIGEVMDAPIEDLIRIGQISFSAATLIKVIAKTTQPYYRSHMEKTCFDSPEKLKSLFLSYFISLKHEEFRIACFDNDLRIMNCSIVNTGTLSRDPIDMRRVVEIVIASKATLIALGHNHVGGTPLPSDADIVLTKNIVNLMKCIDVRVLDHVIVGASDSYSMRKNGYFGMFD
ncbi:MAG: hypothetical protein LUI05_03695 [Oscillospiraceae bacterium]|nr:hypothetical protein [Oscillospiraceae bacterium]